jgi:Skp family chaperone for outer membrane proteins
MPLMVPQNFERAQAIDTSLGVLEEQIQKYRAELNASRRQEFSRHFKSVSDKIEKCCNLFKLLATEHHKRRDAAAK